MKKLLSAFKKNMTGKRIICLSIGSLSLLLFLILTMYCRHIIAGLQDQQAGKRWVTDGSGYAQVSVFLMNGQKLDSFSILSNHHMVEEKIYEVLGEDVRTAYELRESSPLISCYSGQGIISITAAEGERKTADNVNAIGVGGDFFHFHPVELISGRWFTPEETMKDSLVLDEYTAFRLFGSSDVEGQMVTIGSQIFYVRGVYRVADNKMVRRAGAKGGFVFVPYEAFGGTDNGVNCLEYAAVEPFRGYLKKTINLVLGDGLSEQNRDIVDNASRFQFGALLGVATNLPGKVMQTKAIQYPYWENVARGYEVLLSMLLMVRILLLVIPGVELLHFLIYKYRNKAVGIQDLRRLIENAVDRYRVKKRDEKACFETKDESSPS